jgi:hypothetical protein
MAVSVTSTNNVTIDGVETLTNKTISAQENSILDLNLNNFDPLKVDASLLTLPIDDSTVASGKAVITRLATKLSRAENLNDLEDKPTARSNLNVLSATEIGDLIDAINIVVASMTDGINSVTALEARQHIDSTSGHRIINDSDTSLTELWSASKISQEIASALVGVGGAILTPLNTVSELEAINTTDDTTYADKIMLLIEEEGLYRLDRESSAVADGVAIVQPTVGVGRWILVTGTAVPHNDSSGIQGGTTDEYYHLTQAQSEGVPTAVNYAPTSTNKLVTLNQLVTSMVSSNEVVAQSLTRDGSGKPASIAYTFSNGYVLTETINRDVNGTVTSIDKVIPQISLSLTVTIARDGNGNYTGESIA